MNAVIMPWVQWIWNSNWSDWWSNSFKSEFNKGSHSKKTICLGLGILGEAMTLSRSHLSSSLDRVVYFLNFVTALRGIFKSELTITWLWLHTRQKIDKLHYLRKLQLIIIHFLHYFVLHINTNERRIEGEELICTKDYSRFSQRNLRCSFLINSWKSHFFRLSFWQYKKYLAKSRQ